VRTGIISALLAQAGADAPKDPLEGDKGFLKAFADNADWSTLPDDLGKQFKIATCYIKLYPACRHAHAPVDAALRLRRLASPSRMPLKPSRSIPILRRSRSPETFRAKKRG